MPFYRPATLPPVQLRFDMPSLQKTIFIYGAGDLSEDGYHEIKKWIGLAKYKGWLVIVGDDINTDAFVIRLCEIMGIPYKSYGTGTRPRNATSSINYTQLSHYTNIENHMVNQADIIACFWDGKSQSTLDIYNHARNFKNKQRSITTHPMPWIKCRKRTYHAGFISAKKWNAMPLIERIRKAYPNVKFYEHPDGRICTQPAYVH